LLEGVRHLDVRLLETPPVAIDVAKKELHEMARLAREAVVLPLATLFGEAGPENVEKAFAIEKKVNALNRSITEYLSKLPGGELSVDQSETVAAVLSNVADVERVGDHGENIAELVQLSIDEQLPFTDAARKELKELVETTLKAYDLALEAWV